MPTLVTLGATPRAGGVRIQTIKEDSPQVTGSLPPEVIHRILRRHLNEARLCYEQRLRANPGLQGQIVMQMVISPQGTVTQSAARQNSLGDAAVASCLAARSRRWRFPQPAGNVRVVARYQFSTR